MASKSAKSKQPDPAHLPPVEARIEAFLDEVYAENGWFSGHDLRIKLRELFAARPSEQTWQPMETGPKGKSVVICFTDGSEVQRITKATYFAVGELDMDDDVPDDAVTEEGKNAHAGWFEDSETREPYYWPLGGYTVPTHWMPLPDPPVASTHGGPAPQEPTQ